MKKGQICEGIVQYTDFPNKALVITNETDGQGNNQEYRVTVKGALPGQKISYVVKKARRDKCQGRLKEVIEKSPLETQTPACDKFGICGGCNYQSLPYNEQLNLKKAQVQKLIDGAYQELSQAAEKNYIYDGIVPSPDVYEYRNKMEFSFGDEYKGGPLALGLHKKGSMHDIVNADGCKIVHSDFSKILSCVRNYFYEKQIPHYNKNTHIGVLRHLLVRKSISSGELLVALVTSSQQDLSVQLKELSKILLQVEMEGKLSGFLHIVNDTLGDVVKSDETNIIYGKDWFMEEILGLKFRITPFSFFQTNTKGAEVLYTRARDYILENFSFDKKEETLGSILKDKTVFDLYSGTGTIAQIIAPIAKKVIGVEIVEEAVQAAKENAELNGLSNCEFIAGDVLKVIDDIEEKPDFIILDPPRDGIHPKALRKIIDYGVDRIVYISCKPTSLARDLVVLEEHGYHLERMSNVDMFPGTVHVETVVLLSKLKSTHHIEVEISMDEMDLTKAESKATYAEIKAYVLEKFGLKVSQLYIAQVKRKHGLIERINYNMGDGKSRVPQVTPEKEKAIEDALRYFQMIE